jgi:predicted Zn-dependent protease
MKLLFALLFCLPVKAQIGIIFYDGCESQRQDSIIAILSQKIKNKAIVPLPAKSFPKGVEKRDSGYDATSLINHALKLKPDSLERLIVITNRPMLAQRDASRNWGLFGYSMYPDGVVVVSTKLLQGQNLVERVVKVSLHELQHTYGKGHCSSPSCLMNVGNGYMTELDKRKYLCEACNFMN